MKPLNIFLALFVIAGTPHAQVLPPHSTVEGKTIGEWTAEYNRWAFLQPTNQNPLLDSDGSRATNGQAGPVFFVAGGLEAGSQPRRHYTVREDKYLLVPLVVIEVDNIDVVPPLPVEELRDIAGELIDTTSQLHLSLGGRGGTNLFNHREVSPVFNFEVLSPDNLFTYFYSKSITGLVDPAVADGYWAMIEPLGVGTHVLEFGGTYGSPNSYSYARNDIITVVPASPMELITSLVQSVETSTLPEIQQRAMKVNLEAAKKALDRKRPKRGAAARRLGVFEKQVRHAFPDDSATASNWVQRAEKIINRTLGPLPPLTNGAVLGGSAQVAGKTIGGLEVELWNWIYSIPTNQNPLLDCGSGRWADNGQPNPLVFFIAPVNGNMPPCSRTFTVPEHKHILMPVMGVTLDNINIDPPLTLPQMRDTLDSALTNPIALFATIDGVTVPNLLDHRNTAPAFSFNFTNADNVQSLFYPNPIVGLIDPIIADGYWLLLEPLSTGQHVLHGGGQNIYHLPHDVLSHITVEQVPLEEWMVALKYWVQNAPASAALAGKLIPDLDQAQARFRRGSIRSGIAELRSFQKKVRTRLLPADATLANDLMRYAERVIYRAGKEL